MNKCQKCGSTKNLHVKARQTLKSGKVSTYYYCRSCSNERILAYRRRTGCKAQNAANKRWEAKHPGWRAAWRKKYNESKKKTAH